MGSSRALRHHPITRPNPRRGLNDHVNRLPPHFQPTIRDAIKETRSWLRAARIVKRGDTLFCRPEKSILLNISSLQIKNDLEENREEFLAITRVWFEQVRQHSKENAKLTAITALTQAKSTWQQLLAEDLGPRLRPILERLADEVKSPFHEVLDGLEIDMTHLLKRKFNRPKDHAWLINGPVNAKMHHLANNLRDRLPPLDEGMGTDNTKNPNLFPGQGAPRTQWTREPLNKSLPLMGSLYGSSPIYKKLNGENNTTSSPTELVPETPQEIIVTFMDDQSHIDPRQVNQPLITDPMVTNAPISQPTINPNGDPTISQTISDIRASTSGKETTVEVDINRFFELYKNGSMDKAVLIRQKSTGKYSCILCNREFPRHAAAIAHTKYHYQQLSAQYHITLNC